MCMRLLYTWSVRMVHRLDPGNPVPRVRCSSKHQWFVPRGKGKEEGMKHVSWSQYIYIYTYTDMGSGVESLRREP